MGSLSLLLLFSLTSSSAAISCPSGYIDGGDGSCYSRPLWSNSRFDAYDSCSRSGGYLYDIQNAFQNSFVRQQASSVNSVWLGLTCLSNSFYDCQWDVKTYSNYTYNYNSFMTGPNGTLGACVYMDIPTGIWYSGDCSRRTAYGCKYTPNIVAPRCYSIKNYPTITFRSNCLIVLPPSSYSSANTTCVNLYANLSSIHSPAENLLIHNLVQSSTNSTYMYNGLMNYIIGGIDFGYIWADSSSVNYLNFGYENKAVGQCVAMALMNDFVSDAAWMSSNCASPLPSVCVMPYKSQYNIPPITPAPTTDIPTRAPPICSSPIILSGNGTVYSPGYSFSSDHNTCQYLVSVDQYHNAELIFTDVNLGPNSILQFYSGISEAHPFQVFTYYNITPNATVFSSTNFLKMVFSTPGDNSKWAANFRSLIYPCGGNYSVSGNVTSPGFPGPYPQLSMYCVYVLNAQNNKSTCVKFDELSLRVGDFIEGYDGYVGGSRFDPIPGATRCSFLNPYVTILFQTLWTNTGTGQGFFMRFASNWQDLDVPSTTTIQPTSSFCGNTYYGNGTINSQNYPLPYPAGKSNCTYVLNSNAKKTCLVFDALNLRTKDSVALYDGLGNNILIAKFIAGDIAPGVYCTRYSPNLFVLFSTLNPTNSFVSGFLARFAADSDDLAV